MMHILILASGYPTEYSSNQGIFFRDQAESLARDKSNQVAVIAAIPISIRAVWNQRKWSFGLKKSFNQGVRTAIHTFLNIPKLHRYRLRKSQNLGMKMISAYMEEFGKPDVIHVHGFQAGLVAITAKSKFGIPYVITEHSSQFIDDIVPESIESDAKAVFKHADAAIAVSPKFAQLMEKRYQRAFLYVPNVVDTDLFVPGQQAAEKGNFTFFNAAGFYVEKNHPLLLEAFSKVVAKHPGVRLRLAGNGIYESQMKDYSAELGIDKQVEFLGLLPRKEIVREMQQMDAFVLSSKVETFGVVLIEALSCGKPVVATRSFGPESIIVSPEFGVLCEQDAEDLSLAMENMILEYSNYNKETIRKFVIERFSNDAVMQQLMQIYRQVITKTKSNA